MKLNKGAGLKLAVTLVASLIINTIAVSLAQAANEVTRLVPFQGRLHGTDNKAVADGVFDLTFNIYDTATGGTPAWTESHLSVSVIHGYVNILLGAIQPLDNGNSSVDFTTQKFLGISIDGGVEMFPRSQLVPSFHAKSADHAEHATLADTATNALNLGGKAANTYAQISHVDNADNVLGARISEVELGLDGDVNTVKGRVTTLEGKFTGTKAKDADLLDGQNSTYYATDSRMDAIEAKFTGTKAKDADKLDGKDYTYFLSTTGKAADANLLDNHDTSYFATKAELDRVDGYIDSSGKANDANRLDNIDSTGFMRNINKSGHYGLYPDGNDATSWVRTTTHGLLPFASTTSGISSLGTSAWQFSNIWGQNIYDGKVLLEDKYLGKTAKANTAGAADTATSANYASNAGLLDNETKANLHDATKLTGTISTARLPAASTTVRGATKKNEMKNSQNGYFWDKETGYIIQWGVFTANAGTLAGSVTFPTTFTSAYTVTTTARTANSSWNTYEGSYISNLQANYFSWDISNAVRVSFTIHWQAIGYKAP